MIWMLAKRELQQIFQGFGAYALFASAVFISAWFFLVAMEFFILNQAALAARGYSIVVLGAVANTSGWFFLCLVPFLSMSLINSEWRQHSLILLLSSPISAWQIIFGKYLGLWAFLSLVSITLLLMPLSLGLLNQGFDWGLFFSVALAMLLLNALLTAIGLYFSSLSQQAFSAAIGSFSVSLILWVLDSSANRYNDDNILPVLSLSAHYKALLSGRFDSGDVLYFVLLSVLGLSLATRQLSQRGHVLSN